MNIERSLTNPELENIPTYRIPEAMVLDFDRMLGDVSACMQRFYTAADIENIDTASITAARKTVEDDGGSFEPLSHIKALLDQESYERFCRNFIFQPGPEILYPDAKRFLSLLQYADVPHIIMTYGVNPEWQQLKLKASGYPMGYTVTDTPDKSASLVALRSMTPTGQPSTFDMYVAAHGQAKYHADTLTFIDDKGAAFANFPQDDSYKGFWLRRDGQTEATPSNITIIHSLDEIMVTEDGNTILDIVPAVAPYPHKKRRWMCSIPRHYLYRPTYESTAIYLPLRRDAVVHDDDFNGYESFWAVPQVGYSLGKSAAANSVILGR
jgi:hypothetical protein